jgi:hypothetical protein
MKRWRQIIIGHFPFRMGGDYWTNISVAFHSEDVGSVLCLPFTRTFWPDLDVISIWSGFFVPCKRPFCHGNVTHKIRVRCASCSPRTSCKCCAHLPRATRDVTFGLLYNIVIVVEESTLWIHPEYITLVLNVHILWMCNDHPSLLHQVRYTETWDRNRRAKYEMKKAWVTRRWWYSQSARLSIISGGQHDTPPSQSVIHIREVDYFVLPRLGVWLHSRQRSTYQSKEGYWLHSVHLSFLSN